MKPRLSTLIATLAFLPQLAAGFDDALVAAARKEGKVVLYSSAAIDATQKICNAFEKAYPGVKCEFYRATALPLLQRFNTEMEAKQIKADVIHASSVPGFLNAKAKGWLAKSKSPDIGKYLPQFRDADGYYAAARVIPMGIAYNNKLVSAADAPKAWKDVLDPKWKGKMIAPDPGSSGTGLMGFYFWDKHFGLDFIRQFARNAPKMVGSTAIVGNEVASGERLIAAQIDSWEVVFRFRKDLPIAINFPKEGVPVAPSPVAVVAGGPNPNAGQLLMHYVISQAGQQAIMDDLGSYSGRTDMPPLKGMPKLEELKLIDIDWVALQKEQSQVIDTYSKTLKEGAAK